MTNLGVSYQFNRPQRQGTLPPPNPLIQKRTLEPEITYSCYKHRLANEDVKQEYTDMQPCNPEIPPESIPKGVQTYGSVVPKIADSEFKVNQPVAYYWPIKTTNEDGDQTVSFRLVIITYTV